MKTKLLDKSKKEKIEIKNARTGTQKHYWSMKLYITLIKDVLHFKGVSFDTTGVK